MLFFLSLKAINELDTNERAVILSDFGFEKGGVFNVSFTKIQSKFLHYALLPEEEFPLKMMIKSQADRLCKKIPPIPFALVQIPKWNNFS